MSQPPSQRGPPPAPATREPTGPPVPESDAGAPPTVEAPPDSHPMRSVLRLGLSPWMQRVAAPGAVDDDDPMSDADDGPGSLFPPNRPELVSVRKGSLFGDTVSVQDREDRVASRKRKREDQEEQANLLEELEQRNLIRCKLYFYVGCFGLPFVHLISVCYFKRKLSGQGRDFKIKKYLYLSIIVGLIETFIWILWVVVFQLLRDTTLKDMNILNYNYTVGSLV